MLIRHLHFTTAAGRCQYTRFCPPWMPTEGFVMPVCGFFSARFSIRVIAIVSRQGEALPAGRASERRRAKPRLLSARANARQGAKTRSGFATMRGPLKCEGPQAQRGAAAAQCRCCRACPRPGSARSAGPGVSYASPTPQSGATCRAGGVGRRLRGKKAPPSHGGLFCPEHLRSDRARRTRCVKGRAAGRAAAHP